MRYIFETLSICNAENNIHFRFHINYFITDCLFLIVNLFVWFYNLYLLWLRIYIFIYISYRIYIYNNVNTIFKCFFSCFVHFEAHMPNVYVHIYFIVIIEEYASYKLSLNFFLKKYRWSHFERSSFYKFL